MAVSALESPLVSRWRFSVNLHEANAFLIAHIIVAVNLNLVHQ